jgi:hypothetical protein
VAEKTQKIEIILFDFMGVLLFPRIDYEPNEQMKLIGFFCFAKEKNDKFNWY